MSHRPLPPRPLDPARDARSGERRHGDPRLHEPSPWRPPERRWSAEDRYTPPERGDYPGVGYYEDVGGYPGGGQVGFEGFRGGAGYQSGGTDFLHGDDYGRDEYEAAPYGVEHPRRSAAGWRPGRDEPGARWRPDARGYGEGNAYRPRPEEDPRHSIYGRAGGHRGKGPKGYARSDERIREDLCERLAEDDAIDAGEVTVEVRDGVVTLEGSVEQRWMRHRIEDIAAACHGVGDVANHLRVARAEGAARG